jgi:hypothetical protein
MRGSSGKPAPGWTYPKYHCAWCGWGFPDLKAFLRHKARCGKRP